ncbi:MAG: V-type ATP synthase subunit A [Gammaproteobacteria bacterium]
MSDAVIRWISGPVLRARPDGPFSVNEAVLIGEQQLLGEVIRLREDEIVVQVYEDTTGLRPGVPVTGTGAPLAVELGPGLLGSIFDGLLRPLSGLSMTYVRPGMYTRAPVELPFEPQVQVGEKVGPGHVLGRLLPPAGLQQRCLVPPDRHGKVVEVVETGNYREDATLATLETDDGTRHAITMLQRWPVREPRPVLERLPADRPMLTGQRILDALFPVARGGKAALPGGFGTGKTVLQESLAKWCDADIIVYVGCGERGNEMAGVLHEFPELQDPRSGRALMERTVIIANTSNMPVAAREASIYTGVTVAEYFRDQGLHVALMADSTSRWAEALREVSGRLGELPGEAGYPAYLGSRLADFPHQALCAQLLGPGQRPRPGPLLPRRAPAAVLHRRRGIPGLVVEGRRPSPMGRSTPPVAADPGGTDTPGAHGTHRGQRRATSPPAVHPVVRGPHQPGLPAPVVVLRAGPLRLAGTPDRHDESGHPLHRAGPGRGREQRTPRPHRRAAHTAPAAAHGRGDRRESTGGIPSVVRRPGQRLRCAGRRQCPCRLTCI